MVRYLGQDVREVAVKWATKPQNIDRNLVPMSTRNPRCPTSWSANSPDVNFVKTEWALLKHQMLSCALILLRTKCIRLLRGNGLSCGPQTFLRPSSQCLLDVIKSLLPMVERSTARKLKPGRRQCRVEIIHVKQWFNSFTVFTPGFSPDFTYEVKRCS